MVGLKAAVDWYSNHVIQLLYQAPLDADRQKTYETAVKCANLGNDGYNMPGERSAAWNRALHLFEKVWATKGLPKLDDALAAKAKPSVLAMQRVINNLNEALGPHIRYSFSLTATERDYRFDQPEIILPLAELNQLVGVTALKLALDELKPAAMVASQKFVGKDPADPKFNGYKLDGGKFMTVLPLMTTQVSNWATTMDRDAFKPVGKVAPMPTATAPSPVAAPSSVAASATPGAPKTRTYVPKTPGGRDPRLPVDGTILTKTHKGTTYQVRIAAHNSFELLSNGQFYSSLSAIGKVITGASTNGFKFFGL